MKLSKQQAKLHKQALELVRSGRKLTQLEAEFVIENYNEGAEQMNGLAGAFFTPYDLAADFSLEVFGGRVLDLCAGIGVLTYASRFKADSYVCVEINPAYVEVGKAVTDSKVTWVQADVFDVDAYKHLGPFDLVISNPPFGNVPSKGFSGDYTGSNFEYRVIELASTLAPHGAFIIPQSSAPFKYSGVQCYQLVDNDRAKKFTIQTGIKMTCGVGIDTSVHVKSWRGVAPMCEIVVCEFERPL